MLLNRGQELASLQAALDSAASDGGRVVLVRGEAGSGKSALIEDLVRVRGLTAADVIGYCDDLATPTPLGPLWDLAVSRPELRRALSAHDLPGVRASVLDSLSAGDATPLLALEDTHWADASTLDLIRHVGRRISRTRGLFVLTFRDDGIGVDHPLRQVLGDLPADSVSRIQLGPLPIEAVRRMVAGTGLDPEDVLALTGGNPLFVSEVTRAGMDAVPPTITDAVLGQLSRAAEALRNLIDLVAVVPGGLAPSVLDSITDGQARSLEEGAALGLLTFSADLVAFRHEIQRRAVESALSAQRRSELASQLLRALDEGADPALAVHLALAAGDVDGLVRWGPRALASALALGAHREAASHGRRLSPHLERLSLPARADVVEDWAMSEFLLESGDEIPLLRRAVELRRHAGPSDRLGHLLAFAVRAFEVRGHPEEALAALEAAEELARAGKDQDLHLHALALRSWLAMMRGDGDEALWTAEMVLARRASAESAQWQVHAMNSKGTMLAVRGESAGFNLLEECAGRAADQGLYHEQLRALHNLADCHLGAGRISQARDAALRELQEARRRDFPRFEAAAASVLVHTSLAADEWGQVFEYAHSDRLASADLEIWMAAAVGRVQSRRGDASSLESLREGWRIATDQFSDQHRLDAAGPLAEHLWLHGIEEPELVGELAALCSTGADALAWRLGDLAVWLHLLGAGVEPVGKVAEPHRLFLAGDYVAAGSAWSEAGWAYEANVARAQLGGDPAVEALHYFDALGAAPMAQKVRAQLRGQGVRVTRGRSAAARGNPAGLTGRQSEVLELLAKGATNAEIADDLFLSSRTVENHVSAILMKLEARDRADAVRTARERGLVDAQN